MEALEGLLRERVCQQPAELKVLRESGAEGQNGAAPVFFLSAKDAYEEFSSPTTVERKKILPLVKTSCSPEDKIT